MLVSIVPLPASMIKAWSLYLRFQGRSCGATERSLGIENNVEFSCAVKVTSARSVLGGSLKPDGVRQHSTVWGFKSFFPSVAPSFANRFDPKATRGARECDGGREINIKRHGNFE